MKQFNKLAISSRNRFLIRLGIFASLFILVTGLVGPWVVRSKLLYGFHFFIYGNMGKMVLFSALVFLLLTRGKLQDIKLEEYKKSSLLFIAASFGLIPVFFRLGNLLLQQPSFTANLPLSLLTHAVLLLITMLLVPGVFGVKFVQYFLTEFKKEVGVCIGLSIGFYFAIFRVWNLWPYLSDIVLAVVKWLFSLTFPLVRVGVNRRILVQDFAVSIDQACSGIESIFLFSALYVLIAVLDWKKFHKIKLLLLFVPALIGLFLVNILRVYILILIGVLISPQLALQLFHTYAGLVLFVIYFFLFWKVFYKKLLIKL